MLPFRDEFNNENPLANLAELLALSTVPGAIFLVLGNLAFIAPFLYACVIGLYFLAWSILMSGVISWGYHLCQTTHECFQFLLPLHISIDHFTSTSMMGLFLLSLVNVRTVCQLATTRRVLKVIKQKISKKSCGERRSKVCDALDLISREPVYDQLIAAPDCCQCGEALHNHFTYNKIEENMIYDAWTAGSAITVLTVTVIAVYGHPFSYAAFAIVLAVVVVLWFIKVMLIDEGEPVNFIGRISLPELIIGIVLGVIGLAAYVADAYIEYMILHSVWHVAIYLSIMFMLAGTMKSVNGWVPLWEPCYRYVSSCFYG